MNAPDATKTLADAVVVTREDIARAKTYVLVNRGGRTDELAERWLQEQGLGIPRSIDGDSPNLTETLGSTARSISLRLALYQAVCELVAAAELIPSGSIDRWPVSITFKTQRGSTGLRPEIACSFPNTIERPPLVSEPSFDPDIFLQGVNCNQLHPGILEAIEQALGCFRRGLYMPATAMLAAAVEGTWTECATAVAKKLGSAKLEAVVNDPLSSISKIVLESCKALETPEGKALLKAAEQNISKVRDAEVWTTALRFKRNAIHWSKAKSFVADHGETGTLLMAAPMHLGTLEAVRCAR